MMADIEAETCSC